MNRLNVMVRNGPIEEEYCEQKGFKLHHTLSNIGPSNGGVNGPFFLQGCFGGPQNSELLRGKDS